MQKNSEMLKVGGANCLRIGENGDEVIDIRKKPRSLLFCRHKYHTGVNRWAWVTSQHLADCQMDTPNSTLPSLLESNSSWEETPIKRKDSTMGRFSPALIHHSKEQVMGTSLIMIKTITESLVDTGGCNNPSIRYIFIKQITSTSSKWKWIHWDLPVPLAVFAKKRGYKAEQLWDGCTLRQNSCRTLS